MRAPSRCALCRQRTAVDEQGLEVVREYAHPLSPGGPGRYWELPYLLPFDAQGSALPNDRMADVQHAALLFGDGNAAWVGSYDVASARFWPAGERSTRLPVPAADDDNTVNRKLSISVHCRRTVLPSHLIFCTSRSAIRLCHTWDDIRFHTMSLVGIR